MSSITIILPDEQVLELRRMAENSGISVEDLAREGIESIMRQRNEKFRRAASHVLEKNAELYRRLAR